MSKSRIAKCAIRSRRTIALRDGCYHKVEKNQKEPLSFSMIISGNKIVSYTKQSEPILTFKLGDFIKI